MNVKELKELLKDCDDLSEVLIDARATDLYYREITEVNTGDEGKLGVIYIASDS